MLTLDALLHLTGNGICNLIYILCMLRNIMKDTQNYMNETKAIFQNTKHNFLKNLIKPLADRYSTKRKVNLNGIHYSVYCQETWSEPISGYSTSLHDWFININWAIKSQKYKLGSQETVPDSIFLPKIKPTVHKLWKMLGLAHQATYAVQSGEKRAR